MLSRQMTSSRATATAGSGLDDEVMPPGDRLLKQAAAARKNKSLWNL
jgi:hypothetical protein